MLFVAVTLATFIVTFLLNPVSKKVAKKMTGNRRPEWHIHHSVTGLTIFALGLIIGAEVVSAVGLGIYLGHVAEEVYFNKKNPVSAFFILVTHAK